MFDLSVGLIDSIFIFYYYGPANCLIQGESKISLLLENQEVIELGYYGDVDCNSKFRKKRFLFAGSQYLKNSIAISEIISIQNKSISEILSSPVKKVRIYSSEGYQEYEPYDVLEDLKRDIERLKNKSKTAKSNFEKKFYREKYSKVKLNFENGESGAVFYKIPYTYFLPMNEEDMSGTIKTILNVTIKGFDYSADLRNYYGFYRDHTKYALMDMIRVLQNKK